LIQSIQLASGARIILETVANTDVASIGLWQLSGSRDEGDREAGYTHFLEHMLFKGTSKRSAYQIAQAVERVGGYLNAFTEKEVTCFYCTLPGDSIDLAVDVLTDMYFSSLLDEQELQKEKAVIVNEIKTIEDNPEEKGQQIYLESLWNSHPLSRKITGEVHQVEAIDKRRLLDFYKGRYSPSTTVITASGKIDADRLKARLARAFASNGGGKAPGQRSLPVTRLQWQAVPDKFGNQLSLFHRDRRVLSRPGVQHPVRRIHELPPVPAFAGGPGVVLLRIFLPHLLHRRFTLDDLCKHDPLAAARPRGSDQPGVGPAA